MSSEEIESAPLGSELEVGYEVEKRSYGGAWVFLLTGILAAGLLTWMLVPNFVRARTRGQLTACKSNLKNIATALEMYASDNEGYYPDRLEVLTGEGNYLKVIPTCPGAGRVTYTDYRLSPNGKDFSMSCIGNHHKRAYSGFSAPSDNFPSYSSKDGLLEHP